MILETLVAGGSYIMGSFIQSVGPQIARRLIPTQAEKALLANVDLRRQEMRVREEHFLKQIAETRQLKMDEIEKMRLIRREEADYNEQIRRWPLRVLPIDILNRSKSLNGQSLNVILGIVDTNDAEFYKGEGKLIGRTIDMINGSPMHTLRNAMGEFRSDIVFYHETLRGSRLSGDGFRSTLWSLLQTEPTVLIEVNVPASNRVLFYISYWGGIFEPDGTFASPIAAFKPIALDLTLVPSEDDAQRQVALALGLSSVLVSLGDAYCTLQRPHIMHTPVFPALMRNAAAASLPEGVWKPMTKAYLSTYDGVASHSPMVASELAAKAALAAHDVSQTDFAAGLLDKALALYQQASPARRLSDEGILAALARQRGGRGKASELERAMRAIRGVQDAESPTRDLAKMASRSGPVRTPH
jgi:hypothetical protein